MIGEISVFLGHIVNVVIAGYWGNALIIKRKQFTALYGKNSTAREVLAAVYIAVFGTSLWALVVPNQSVEIAWHLFPIQITYLALSVWFISDKKSPVLWWNVGTGVFLLLVLCLNAIF